MMALSIPLGWPACATMPNPAPPICCGRTAMSPRVSGTRPAMRSMPRWRARPASTEVFDHGAVDPLEFSKARRRVSRGGRGASRLERRAECKSRCHAGSDPRQSHRRSRCAARGDRAGAAAHGGCQPAGAATAAITRIRKHAAKGIELMAKGFASTTDMAEKKITFSEIGTDLYAFTAEGDPNSAVIVGDDGCIVFDAQSTPAMANRVIERVRTVTDKPIKYVVLSHYHAVRVLGPSAYKAQAVIASQETHRLVEERGQQDWDSEYAAFRDCSRMPKASRA